VSRVCSLSSRLGEGQAYVLFGSFEALLSERVVGHLEYTTSGLFRGYDGTVQADPIWTPMAPVSRDGRGNEFVRWIAASS